MTVTRLHSYICDDELLWKTSQSPHNLYHWASHSSNWYSVPGSLGAVCLSWPCIPSSCTTTWPLRAPTALDLLMMSLSLAELDVTAYMEEGEVEALAFRCHEKQLQLDIRRLRRWRWTLGGHNESHTLMQRNTSLDTLLYTSAASWNRPHKCCGKAFPL